MRDGPAFCDSNVGGEREADRFVASFKSYIKVTFGCQGDWLFERIFVLFSEIHKTVSPHDPRMANKV